MIDMNKFFGRNVEFKDGRYWMEASEATAGSYVGGTVEVANARWLKDNYKNFTRTEAMDYSTFIHYVDMSNKDLMEAVEALDGYPCFDDELVSEVESEVIMAYVKDIVRPEMDFCVPDSVLETAIWETLYGDDMVEDIVVETGLLVYIPDEEALVEAVIKRLK